MAEDKRVVTLTLPMEQADWLRSELVNLRETLCAGRLARRLLEQVIYALDMGRDAAGPHSPSPGVTVRALPAVCPECDSRRGYHKQGCPSSPDPSRRFVPGESAPAPVEPTAPLPGVSAWPPMPDWTRQDWARVAHEALRDAVHAEAAFDAVAGDDKHWPQWLINEMQLRHETARRSLWTVQAASCKAKVPGVDDV